MILKKKIPETLNQQKESFFNFIKTKEKYSSIIADLFFDDEIGKYDDIEKIKHHLKEKWISKELIDGLETDYTSYLKTWYFYWSIDEYPQKLKELVKTNDKILSSIHEKLIEEYNTDKEIILMDTEEFLEDELKFGKLRNYTDLWREIRDLEQELDKIIFDLQHEEKVIKKLDGELSSLNFLYYLKKKNLKEKIKWKQKQVDKMQKDIIWKRKILNEKNALCKKIEYIKCNYYEVVNQKNWDTIKSCKQSILEIKKEFGDCLEYSLVLDILKQKIKNSIYNIKIAKKNKLAWIVDEYLNYFYFWENLNHLFIRENCHRDWLPTSLIKEKATWAMPTIYSKSRIDTTILKIINSLWCSFNFVGEKIDQDFMNDIFIHTTSFRVLDEILEEWWLISHNELIKRGLHNADISESRQNHDRNHKDVYFSRGFRKNWYWHNKHDEDFVFILNTMNNFARNGYGVPLCPSMQPNCDIGDIDADHDQIWYSIISKSALKEGHTYSKIDIKDVYIFIPETKKELIKNNPKYNLGSANIIYIPREFSWKMNYKLCEFMKEQIELRCKEKSKCTQVPVKVVNEEDYNIESFLPRQWMFCESIWKNYEVLFNPLKNGDYKTILNFLKTNKLLFDPYNELNLKDLEYFLFENKDNIKELKIPFKYPSELLLLIISWVKVRLDLNLKGKLKEFGYSMRDVWIFVKTVNRLHEIGDNIDNYMENIEDRKDKLYEIKHYCDDWLLDFSQMKSFLLQVSNISQEPNIYALVKDILK